MSTFEKDKKVTTSSLCCMKRNGRKISALTAYDATFARLIEQAGIDIVLVGDSLGMVIQGHENTLPVSIDDMIYHTKAVKKGLVRAHLVSDMPFMSYQASVSDAISNAGRLIKEGGAEAVKLEGGMETMEKIKALTSVGIPVMAHIGLKPQSIHQMGGYKIQGRTLPESERLFEEAKAAEDAGAYSIVLEGVAIETAAEITASVGIPTIGISSGPYCDGQILVLYDLLGMNESFSPRFLKKYANLSETVRSTVSEYVHEVKNGVFPTEEHGFHRHLKIASNTNK